MNKISNPSSSKLSLILIPAMLAALFLFWPAQMPLWALIIGDASLAAYLGILAYFCIKQKCITQLIYNCVLMAIVAVLFNGGYF